MLKDNNFLSCTLLSSLGIIFCIAFYNNPIHDYGNYYFGSRFALQGIDIRDIYEPYKFNLLIRDLPDIMQEPFFVNYAVVPPFTLFFYIPLSWFDVHISKFIFNISSVLVFCFFLFRLLRHLDIKTPYVFLLPLLLIIPYRNNILFGQTYLLVTGFLMGGFIAEEKKKNIPAAVFYALAIVLKISPAILIFYLLLRKNFRLLFLTALFSLALFLSAVYFTGWSFMLEYIFSYIPRMSVNEINNPYATTYQSITVLLRNLFIPDQLLNPSPFFNSVIACSLLSGLCTGILFFYLARQLLTGSGNFFLFAFALACGCLFSAYTSSYSLVFLIPVCLAALRMQQKKKMAVLLLIFLISFVPVHLFQSLPTLLQFPRLYLLLILFFLLLQQYTIPPTQVKWLAASIVLFILVNAGSMKRLSPPSEYFLDKEIALLTYDFEFRGKELLLKTITENGPEEIIVPMKDSIFSIEPASQANRSDSPFRREHRLKQLLVNGVTIVYLSDKNRGIGFYALRKVRQQAKAE